MISTQELHCHNCDKYVQFKINTKLEGKHVITCPKCGHEHCRVVKKGKITDDRWDSRNDDYVYRVADVTCSTTSAYSDIIIMDSTSTASTWRILYSN